MRWGLPLHLFEAILGYSTLRLPQWLAGNDIARELLAQLGAVMQCGFEGGSLQRRPHTVLLDADNFYKEKMLPILAEWLLLWLKKHKLGSAESVPMGLLRKTLLRKALTPAETAQLVLSGSEWKMLNLATDWLQIFLPHCLQKVNRVTFGLLQDDEVERLTESELGLRWGECVDKYGRACCPRKGQAFENPTLRVALECGQMTFERAEITAFGIAPGLLKWSTFIKAGGHNDRKWYVPVHSVPESRTRLAIPFVGKDTPSAASEFAHPDVAIGLTCFSYMLPSGQLRRSDFDRLLNHMFKQLQKEKGPPRERDTNLMYNQWVHEVGAEVCGEVVDAADDHERREADVLQLTHVRLYLDSRKPSSSSGVLGETVWRDLSGGFNDAFVRPEQLAYRGGFFKCTPSAARGGAPLRINGSEELMTTLKGNFTLSILMRCDDMEFLRASYVPLSLGGGSLSIGAGRSEESIVLRCRGSSWERELPFSPGLRHVTSQLQLLTFTFGNIDGSRAIRVQYFVGGVHYASCTLPSHPLATATSPELVFGTSRDERGLRWAFHGHVYLLTIQERALSPAGVQEMATCLLSQADAFGMTRPGDGMPLLGAQEAIESDALQLESAIAFCDSRVVTHRRLHNRYAQNQNAKAGHSSTIPGGKGSGNSDHNHPCFLPPRQQLVDSLAMAFTCSAVIKCDEWSGWPFILLSNMFFYTIGRRVTWQPEVPNLHRPQLHTLVVSQKARACEVRYYIDGAPVLRRMFDLGNEPPCKADELLAWLREPLPKDIDEGMSRKKYRGTIYMWLIHGHTLADADVHTMARQLIAHPVAMIASIPEARTSDRIDISRNSLPWSWEMQPFKDRAVPHGWLALARFARVARHQGHTASSEDDGVLHCSKRKPRVQPLYKLLDHSTATRATLELLVGLFSKLPAAIVYYLTQILFPEMMRFQTEKISASGNDLAGRLMFKKRCGFTGSKFARTPTVLCGSSLTVDQLILALI